MKVAALSPLFVFESPTAVDASEQKIAAGELHDLRVVETKAETSAETEALKRETEEGIRRLSRLIRERKEQSDSRDRKRQRALVRYRAIADGLDPRHVRGRTIDKVY